MWNSDLFFRIMDYYRRLTRYKEFDRKEYWIYGKYVEIRLAMLKEELGIPDLD